MSRHTYYTVIDGKESEVVIGWDRPLQGFFMNIHNGVEDEYGRSLYQSLDDDDFQGNMGYSNSVEPFIAKAATYGVTIPKAMVDELNDDKQNNVGNKVKTHA